VLAANHGVTVIPAPDEVSPTLRALWSQRARELTGILASDGRSHLEIAKATRLISEDYHDRFLIELLQNANDQAARARLTRSTVIIVRTRNLVAVTNSGSPVTETNLARISSLADSDKAGTTIGNKGVGFKAVYQVTDAPEVYSAPIPDGPDAPQSVLDTLGVGAALSVRPEDDGRIRAAVEAEVRVHMARNPGIAEDLARLQGADPATAVVRELARAAGFKFPLPRTPADWANRTAELALPSEHHASIQTVVVLPLRDDKARSAARKTLRDLVESAGSGLPDGGVAMLFLPSVDRLEVIDRVEEETWTFQRRAVPASERDDDTPLDMIEIATTGPSEATTRRYWLASADALDAPPEELVRRRAIVSTALEEFGLEGWTESDPLPVTVAVPCPPDGETMPLGASGRLCLGLPTQQETGLPAHVDARFYARINRTGVFDDHDYNALLLDVAAGVFAGLVGHLRESACLSTRRAATLALARNPRDGTLATRAFAEGGVGSTACVLDWSGTGFRSVDEVRLPGDDDLALLPLVEGVLAPNTPLPERGLLNRCVDALSTLDLRALDHVEHPWVIRDKEDWSVLERVASANRTAGRDWWTQFMQSVLALHHSWGLADQRILPVGRHELACANQRAYLPTRGGADIDEDEVPVLPDELRGALRMLDDHVLLLRKGPRADYSELARQLREQKLAREPRKVELLNEVIFPGIETADDTDTAFDLWFLAMDWLSSMSRKSLDRLRKRVVRVPVRKRDGSVAWVPADEAYLGDDWGLERNHEELLEQAYPDARTPSPKSFADIRPMDDETLDGWRKALDEVGVHAHPRVIELDRPRKPWPLEGAGGVLRVSAARGSLPDPQLDAIYGRYLTHVARGDTPWSWTFPHDLKSVCWLDGLQNPAVREAVVDLVLQKPGFYINLASTDLKRVGHNPIRPVPTLWAFALAHEGWPVFPVHGVSARLPAAQTWQLPERDRRPAWADLQRHVPAQLAPARALLETLGVHSTQTAHQEQLFGALDDLAARLQRGNRLDRAQLALATELYRQLDRALKSGGISSFPTGIRLPLRRGRELRTFDPTLDTQSRVLFDDDPARGRHLPDREALWIVPLSSGTAPSHLVACFTSTLGKGRVLRSETAPIALQFTPAGDTEPFLSWLMGAFLRTEVPVHLAALLAYGGDRTLGMTGLKAPWERLQKLQLLRGTFSGGITTAFYDGQTATLRVDSELASWDVLSEAWPVAGQSRRDLWEGYARSLHDDRTAVFLGDRDIGDVELSDAAEAVGLRQNATVEPLACALLAAWAHRTPAATLTDADLWWSGGPYTPDQIAEFFGMPELAARLRAALLAPPPAGELALLERLGVPLAVWQEAVTRRDGTPHRFPASAQCFERARDHIIAVARALAAGVVTRDLSLLTHHVAGAAALPVPGGIIHAPRDEPAAQQAALDAVRCALDLADLHPWREAWPQLQLPWGPEWPVPVAASRRDVIAYRDTPPDRRRLQSNAAVQALVSIAGALAPTRNETVDRDAILREDRLSTRIHSEWAHPFAAMAALRSLLKDHAPETAKRLSDVRAFHEPRTETALRALLPELSEHAPPATPRSTVLEVELSHDEVAADLGKGAHGQLGARLREAARTTLDPSLLPGQRSPLAQPTVPGGSGNGQTRLTKPPRFTVPPRVPAPPRERALTGDLGEAFVHEWLTWMLGEGYHADAWRSMARTRYGLPGEGNDALGYDFEVSDPAGRLFGVPARTLCIEVKSTVTGGEGAFPMSQPEWDTAEACHLDAGERVYVIARVVHADTTPRIGDVLIDPVAMEHAGTLRRRQRDLWISAGPRQILVRQQEEELDDDHA